VQNPPPNINPQKCFLVTPLQFGNAVVVIIVETELLRSDWSVILARGEPEYDGTGVPGPSVPGGCGDRENHEDAQNPDT